jgi:hypothetical protein
MDCNTIYLFYHVSYTLGDGKQRQAAGLRKPSKYSSSEFKCGDFPLNPCSPSIRGNGIGKSSKSYRCIQVSSYAPRDRASWPEPPEHLQDFQLTLSSSAQECREPSQPPPSATLQSERLKSCIPSKPLSISMLLKETNEYV